MARSSGPELVDWDLAASTAGALGKGGPTVSPAEASAAVADLRRLAAEAVGHVESYTGMESVAGPAPVRVVDRQDWADANIAGLRSFVGPLLTRVAGARQPGPVADAVGSRLTGVQTGVVLAFLSGRVLGQYEVFSSNPGQLLLVAPNIVEVERRLEANPRDFRLWVCLHEATHRLQFTGVSWLREHFLSEVTAFVEAGGQADELVARVRQALRALADTVRNPAQERTFSVLDLVQTPAQRAVLDRITALMTLLEGHAEFVMDGVGPEVVPSVEDIRAKFNRRRDSANPIERLVRRLLGIDAKLRQYAEGRRFVHEVVSRVGMSGFNRVWQSPQSLPTLAELAAPTAWVERVGPHPLPATG